MTNPAAPRGEVHASQTPKSDRPKSTAPDPDPQAAAVAALGAALAADPRPDARVLSDILRDGLDDPRLILLACAVAWSMRPDLAAKVAEAIRHDAICSLTIPPGKVAATPAAEIERQRQRWRAWCRKTQGGRRCQ